jgi:hypothetical protein
MSMQQTEESSPAESSSTDEKGKDGGGDRTGAAATEKTETKAPTEKKSVESAQLVVSKDDFEKMIADLPGVDMSDPRIQVIPPPPPPKKKEKRGVIASHC